MSAGPVWCGAVIFGMVCVPVELIGAVQEKDVRFHHVNRERGSRPKKQIVCSSREKFVTGILAEKGDPWSASTPCARPWGAP